MNERIIKLYEQAQDEVVDSDCADYYERIQLKFAELIVRECINIACQYDEPKMSGPGMIIATRIETHFGVEE